MYSHRTFLVCYINLSNSPGNRYIPFKRWFQAVRVYARKFSILIHPQYLFAVATRPFFMLRIKIYTETSSRILLYTLTSGNGQVSERELPTFMMCRYCNSLTSTTNATKLFRITLSIIYERFRYFHFDIWRMRINDVDSHTV